MMTFIKSYILVLLIANVVYSKTPALTKNQTAAQVIETFYTDYIGKFLRKNRPGLTFSKHFQALIDKNETVCKEKAGTNICGYGASGDVYFNAQEIDPHLTVKNSGMKVTEPTPGEVHLNLNVFPSRKGTKNPESGKDYYDRLMVFKMTQEEGRWVVDDILEKGKYSQRKQIEVELALYSNK